MVFSALALFLMVADTRFQVAVPLRVALGTALYPLQWLVIQPVPAAAGAGAYFTSLHRAQASENEALQCSLHSNLRLRSLGYRRGVRLAE